MNDGLRFIEFIAFLVFSAIAILVADYLIRGIRSVVLGLINWLKAHFSQIRNVMIFILLSLFVLVLVNGNIDVLLIFLFVMAFYYFLLWLFVSRKPLKYHGKPYRLALFIIGCYWGLFVPYAMMHDYMVDPREYDLNAGSLLFIQSIILSILFFGAVYVYQHYVKDEVTYPNEEKGEPR